ELMMPAFSSVPINPPTIAVFPEYGVPLTSAEDWQPMTAAKGALGPPAWTAPRRPPTVLPPLTLPPRTSTSWMNESEACPARAPTMSDVPVASIETLVKIRWLTAAQFNDP